MTGIDLFVETLQKWGVPFIATLCGHGLNPLDAACHRAGLRLVDVRNEQAAGYMAEAYGRLTGRVGVCASSSGVAHVNALTGVMNAYFDGAPMLLVTGSGAARTLGMGHFQDVDHVALAAPICKYARLIDHPERVPEILHDAWTAAVNGRPGPVHVTFPMDVMQAEVEPERVFHLASAPVRTVAAGDSACIEEAVRVMAEACRPLLIAGSGVFYAGGEAALVRLAEAQAIPIVTPIWDRGAVSRPVRPFMSVVGAATGGAGFLADADCLIVAGAAPDYRLGYLQPPAINPAARIIRIDADPYQLQKGAGAQVSIAGDPRRVLEQLADACADAGCTPTTSWLDEARQRQDAFRQRCMAARAHAPGGLHALDIVAAVQEVMTGDTVLIVDGGNIGQWCHQALCDRYPGHWLTCGASGVVGFGLPAAMTARLVYPDRPVILVTGDGALTFTIAELESAARQGLGFAVVLADDQAWGITLTEHLRVFGQGITSELGPVAFDQVARGFGAHGLRVREAGEIAPAIRAAMTGDRPTLIHVPVVRSSPRDAG